MKGITVLLHNLKSKRLYNKLNNLISQFEMSLKEIQPIATAMFFEDNISALKNYFERIQYLLSDDLDHNNLRGVLDSFKVDVKKICYETLQQESKKLALKNIKYDFFFSNNPCVIFGEEKEVVLIFKNLIENIHKHSKGSICYIYGIINNDDNKLSILFIDNGDNIESIPIGNGILSVMSSVDACRGSFSISNIDSCKHKKTIQDKFDYISNGIVADVTLSLLTNI